MKYIFSSLTSAADGTVDSGQGSSVYTESCVSSQQTVSYGSQHDQSISTAPVQGYPASVGQVQSQQHGGYQPPAAVSQNLKYCKCMELFCFVFLLKGERKVCQALFHVCFVLHVIQTLHGSI